jgi:hypothetical protein
LHTAAAIEKANKKADKEDEALRKAGKPPADRVVVKKKPMVPSEVKVVYTSVATFILSQGGTLTLTPKKLANTEDLTDAQEKAQANQDKKSAKVINNRITQMRVMVQIAINFKEEAHEMCKKLFDDPEVILTTCFCQAFSKSCP